ncbi:MAG: nuclear transport factor 2 family protein [Saprospiraceae bacterium]|nr:nuclear transport factor 2 family protein [Saprospiraceae bacterium]
MKNVLFSAATLLFLTTQTFAQSSGFLWAGSRSGNPDAEAVYSAISKAYDAIVAGDVEKGFAVYTDQASEIGPDGNITHGKKAMLESWNAFVKMTDETPKFSYSNVQVRLLTKDVALAIWESDADIKIGGQQLGGKSRGAAVMRKIGNEWKLEFDQMTPMLGMPALDAAGKN